MTNDIKGYEEMCRQRRADTNVGCNRGSCHIVYITFEKSFDISNRQLQGATASPIHSLTHLLTYLVIC